MSEYFLQVDLLVRNQDCVEFEKRMEAFMKPHSDDPWQRGGFDRIDPKSTKTLVLALKGTEPTLCRYHKERVGHDVRSQDSRASQNPAEGDHCRYVHVWRIGSAKDLDLARIMMLCADDDEYRALDALVVRETQNFTFRVPWLSDLPELEAEPRLKLFRLTRQLATKELGAYLFSLGALIPTLELGRGPRSMGFFQTVTGQLNTVVEFWQADDERRARLSEILVPPRDIVERVVGAGSPVLDAFDGGQVSWLYEPLESYLPPEYMQIRHIQRTWRSLETSSSSQARGGGPTDISDRPTTVPPTSVVTTTAHACPSTEEKVGQR